MAIFNGIIPTITLFKNSSIDSGVRSKLSTLGNAGLNYGLSQALGESLSTKLGIAPPGKSNFIGSIAVPGLINTGVQGLSQYIDKSITNSQALGPFGPFAGNLVNTGVVALANQTSNVLKNTLLPNLSLSANQNPNLYFPGAGGAGEGEANYATGGLLGQGGEKKQPYSLGNGGPDVIFSIVPASLAQAAEEARKSTKQKPAAQAPPGSNTSAAEAPKADPSQVVANAPNSAAPSNTESSIVPYTPALNLNVSDFNNIYNFQNVQNIAFRSNDSFLVTGVEMSPLEPSSLNGFSQNSAVTNYYGKSVGQPKPNIPKSAKPTQSQPPKEPWLSETVGGWKFICPPEDISWETTFQSERVPIFGLNDAPVIGGSKSMRDLTLNNAIVEGFTRGKTITQKIYLLENLMRMKMGQGSGAQGSQYVQIPVYKVYSNNRAYGYGNTTEEKGFFIIKSIKVQEKLRDLNGNTTRAMVDISLTQVPAYQVNSGRDIASAFLPSVKGPFNPLLEGIRAASKALINAFGNKANQDVGGAGNASGNEENIKPSKPLWQNTPSANGLIPR
jgi:hypothetical protein